MGVMVVPYRGGRAVGRGARTKVKKGVGSLGFESWTPHFNSNYVLIQSEYDIGY